MNNLERFLSAQKHDYEIALSEIKAGEKRSHWMWYIFPQIQGLGYSQTSQYYAICDIDEARAYLNHEILGSRLIEICGELLKLENCDADAIFGFPDDMKLKSSATLFSQVENANPVFQKVLDKFFDGKADKKTLEILEKHQKI